MILQFLGDTRELGAERPKSARSVVVFCFWRRSNRLAVLKILAGQRGRITRACKAYDELRSCFGRRSAHLGEPEPGAVALLQIVADSARNEAGTERPRDHALAGQPSRQFPRKKDIAELRSFR